MICPCIQKVDLLKLSMKEYEKRIKVFSALFCCSKSKKKFCLVIQCDRDMCLSKNAKQHGATRVILHLRKFVKSLIDDLKPCLVLISKRVCDESQKKKYKMKFENEADSYFNIFKVLWSLFK